MTEKPEQTQANTQNKPSVGLNFLLLSAGSIFTSMVIAGFLVGYFLDQLFGTTPIMLLSCAVLGFIGGIQKVHKLSSRLDPLPEDKKGKDDNV